MKINVNFTVKDKNVEWTSESPVLFVQGDEVVDLSATTIVSVVMEDLNIQGSEKGLVRDITITHNGKAVFTQKDINQRDKVTNQSCWARNKMIIITSSLALLSIYGLMAKHIEAIQLPSAFPANTSVGITDVAYVLSSSYLAGFIFYILTVFIPYRIKRKIIRKHIHEVIRYLKDSFYDAFVVSFGAEWYKSEKFGEDFYNQYWKSEQPASSNLSVKRYLYEYVAQLDRYLYSALSYPEYLYDDELKALFVVINSSTLSKIRHSFSEKDREKHTKEQVVEILNGFQIIYVTIENLYNSFGR